MPGFDYEGYPIVRPDGPPPPRRKSYQIWSVPPGEPTVCRVLSPQIAQFMTHYLRSEKRTVLCGGPKCMVDHADKAGTAKWDGYLLASLQTHVRTICIVHITDFAARNCPALTDKSRMLTNARLTLQRLGKSQRSALRAAVDYDFWRQPVTIRPADVYEHMLELFSAANNEARRQLDGQGGRS